jgi:hypothetical protein
MTRSLSSFAVRSTIRTIAARYRWRRHRHDHLEAKAKATHYAAAAELAGDVDVDADVLTVGQLNYLKAANWNDRGRSFA